MPGTAVFMTANPDAVPHALLHSLKHYKSLHERVVLLTAVTLDVPHVPPAQRVAVESINAQFHKVKVFFGFMDDAGPAASARVVRRAGPAARPDGHVVLPRPRDADPEAAARTWRCGAKSCSSRCTATRAASPNYFNLPPNRVVELGSQVAL